MKQPTGVYPTIVVDNVDPENKGRVRVRIPAEFARDARAGEAWARVATLMAGPNRGTWFIPEVKDEVLIAFEGGDPRHPYVIGGLWSRSSPPPETMTAANNRKVLRSRSGVRITIDDQGGRESVTIETPGGQKVELKDGPGAVVVRDGNGNVVELGSSGITVNASSKVTLNASAAEVSAGMLIVNAGMAKFSGVVQCDSLITNSVISQSYTPGAGNIS